MIGICGRLESNKIMEGEVVTWLIAFADDSLIRYYPAREVFDSPSVQWAKKSNAIVLLYRRALEGSRIPPDFLSRAKCRRLLASKSRQASNTL